MNVLVAKNAVECSVWKGTAVVLDVFRTATTVCALLAKGNKRPVVCVPDGQTLQPLYEKHTDFSVLSDEDISLPHTDNSPYIASKLAVTEPVFIVSHEAGQAVAQLRKASLVLLGGFCNFRALVQALRTQRQDVLLVPATLFGAGDADEDILCAQAIKEFLENISTPGQFLDELASTVRLSELCRSNIATIRDDLKLALTLDRYTVVPQAAFGAAEPWTICFPLGQQPDPAWAHIETADKESFPVQNEQFETMAELTLRPMLEKTMMSTFLAQDKAALANPTAPVQPAEEPADHPQNMTVVMEPLGGEKIEEPLPQIPDEAVQPETAPRKSLKGFFSNIIRSVKEEKEAWEKTRRAHKPAAGPAPSAPAPVEKPQPKRKKAIVLFSGGLDSTTCLYWALAQGYTCEALSVSYGQRHLREVVSAQAICKQLGVKHHLIDLNLPWLEASSLVDENKSLPDIAVEKIPQAGVPSTYVPGRNLMFLSLAGSLLDAIGADAIIAGPNAVDFSGYPDCTPAFFKAAGEALNRGTLRGVREGIEVLAPLMKLSKAEIVKLAVKLNVPLKLTWSCYAGGEKPCGKCDSCKLRAKGFAEAGVQDPSIE